MDAINARLNARVIVVSILPNLAFTTLIAFVLVAGAPWNRPTWHAAAAAVRHNLGAAIGGAILVVIVSIVLHPLQYPLIQRMEGYWLDLPWGRALGDRLRREIVGDYHRLKRLNRTPDAQAHAVEEAQRRLKWIPDDPDLILPTELGNTLRSGEIRAGDRYRHDTGVVLPRLMPLLPDLVREQLNDLRNQLDSAVRFCALCLVATAVTVPLLFRYDVWLLLSFGAYLLAWASYRASVAAARRFCTALEVVFDLYRLTLFDALGLARPPDMQAELEQNAQLSLIFDGQPLTDDEYRRLSYRAAV